MNKNKQRQWWRPFAAVLMVSAVLGSGTFVQSAAASVIASDKVQSPPDQTDETRIVRGVVKDDKGEILPGVLIHIKGKKGAYGSTNSKGEYRVKLFPGDEILVFTLVGMTPVEVNVENRGIINVTMREDVSALKEVVVTGIFTKPKESFTGSVSTITNKELKTYRAQNLLQTLKNIDASIYFPVNNLVGSDPNALPQIQIRGNSSLPSLVHLQTGANKDANMPLIIMDGFEVSLQKLMDYNEEEIQSINILKDASATAIYGSRGANGVIVIITKQPEEGKLKVSGTVGMNLELPDLSSYNLLDARGKLEVERLAGLYDGDSPDLQMLLDQRYSERLKLINAGRNTDWLSLPLRNGLGQRYNLRVEGGRQEFRWSTGLSYNKVNGAMKGSSRDTFNGDITLSYYVRNLIFRNNTSFNYTMAKDSKYGTFGDYARMSPYEAPYDENGNLIRSFPSASYHTQIPNPLYNSQLNVFHHNKTKMLTNNFTIDWTPLEGLRMVGRLGVGTSNGSVDDFKPAEHSSFTSDQYKTPEGRLRRGSYDYTSTEGFTLDGNVTTSYAKTFANKHHLYLGFDFSVAENRSKYMNVLAEGFSNQNLTTIGNALRYAKDRAPSGNENISRRMGFTGNVNYTFDNRYYFDGSYRLDGSSQFGSNRRFAPFWSAGLGWNIHNEPFLKGNEWLTLLRLKGSLGSIGSIDYDRSSVLTSYIYPSNTNYLNWNGAKLLKWGNPDLTWQKTKMNSLGLEFAFLRNRINGRVEYYHKTTSALTSKMNIEHAMGFPDYAANIGSVRNYGVESYLNVYLFRAEDNSFNWMVGGQLVHDKSYILTLSDAIKRQNEEAKRKTDRILNFYEEGMPIKGIYAVRSLGIDPMSGQEILLNREGVPVRKYDPNDKVFIGDASPKYRGIANTSVYWKGLSLNVSGAFRAGGYLLNSTLQNKVEVNHATIAVSNVDARVLNDRWKEPGDQTFFQGFKTLREGVPSSRFVMKDNTFEIQSISLQYRLTSDKFRKMTGLSSSTVSLNLNNVAYFSTIRQERGTSYPFARNIVATVSFIY